MTGDAKPEHVDQWLLKQLAEDQSTLGKTARAEIDRLRAKLRRADKQSTKLEEACDEIIELRAQARENALVHNSLIEKLQEAVQLELFWKDACARALRLWDREAEKNERALDAIERTLGRGSTCLSHESWHDLETLLDE